MPGHQWNAALRFRFLIQQHIFCRRFAMDISIFATIGFTTIAFIGILVLFVKASGKGKDVAKH
jgi:hypothetical protein